MSSITKMRVRRNKIQKINGGHTVRFQLIGIQIESVYTQILGLKPKILRFVNVNRVEFIGRKSAKIVGIKDFYGVVAWIYNGKTFVF